MKFKNPIFFVIVLPLIWILWRAYFQILKGKYAASLKTPWHWLINVKSVKNLVSPRFIPLVGYAMAMLLMIVALARPQTSFQKIKRSVEGIDIVIVLDISASMRIEDFRDSNRIDVAKSVIRDFITGRQTDRIGLIMFSGEPVTLAPPTMDYAMILQQLRTTEIGDLKDGTAIGDALSLAVSRFTKSTAKSKVIILVTDGDNNVGQVDPMTAGELAKGFGIKVYSIAIGREGRVRMPFVQKDLFGRSYRTYQYFDSSINPELLRKISTMTSGKFYRVQDDEKLLQDVFSEIDQLEKTTVQTSEQVKYDEKFAGLLKIALLILMCTWILQQTVLRVYP